MRIVFTVIAVFLFLCRPALAQKVTEYDGQVFFKFGEKDFLLCRDGHLDEGAYAALLGAYMDFTVRNDLLRRYLKIYDRQNEDTEGELDRIVTRQRLMTTPEQLAILYAPYEKTLNLEVYFKLHVLHASSITAILSQEMGPGKVRMLCRPQ